MINIDGIAYDIPIISVNRKAEFLDKYAERTAAGVLKRELIGVYYNYEVKFGRTSDTSLYAALWLKLTEPVEFHDVIVWDQSGEYPFTAYFAGVSDELLALTDPLDPVTFWRALTANFIAKSPARIPA